MAVAVVIPMYNGVGIVDRCISAVLRQTEAPDEIICVDDFSKDNTYEHVRQSFPEVTVMRNEFNIGASGSYARGIKEAVSRGHKLIWLLDQDDVPSKRALEELLSFLLVGKAVLTSVLVFPLLNLVYDMPDHTCGVFSWRRPDPRRPHEVLLSDFSGMLLPSRVISSVGLPSPKLRNEVADWEFSVRIRSRGWRIIRVPGSIIYHVGGRPKLGPKIYGRRRIRFQRDTGSLEISSPKMVPISSYPRGRYFERGRNIASLLRSPCTPSCVKIFALKWIAGTLVKIPFLEEGKREKMGAYLSGLLYGVLKND